MQTAMQELLDYVKNVKAFTILPELKPFALFPNKFVAFTISKT
jgi:hypothetical protein